MYEMVNTHLNFLVFMKATQLKYALNSKLLLVAITFFTVEVLNCSGAVFFKVENERSFYKLKWSCLFKRLSEAVILNEAVFLKVGVERSLKSEAVFLILLSP